MLTHQNFRFYLFLFLAFCVLSSKNVFIYNEETLVALSFFCFILFTFQYFGTTIQSSLDERSQIIQNELQNFLDLKQISFQQLLKEHRKVSDIVQALKNINRFTNVELLTLHSQGEKALANTFILQVQQRIKILAHSKVTLQQKLQTLLSENVLSNVLLSFQHLKTRSEKTIQLQNQTIKNAIQLLVVNSRKG